ncbi:alpha-galactosidase [Streptococcus pseudoporcinus]|uniref:Alpha-galactosidase n=1 Tax=Streptococcus pseudoporcinus LQ 940-04 TaxID=875093 RepID=G5K8N8_9STRE|nr:alpha-galactosidase [Streptococcus pseudoporcinus]EFR43871.1 alpha-galactosidase [Streptococcus pseudoporcinus SPIN 20026]EHI64949.1 alpha-galactosidase [Streptococcus pseudoporcinus LQ 940-04]VEF94335.1 alpha-galactosidase [Streptococcus pseudoporcinus]
MSIKFKPKTKEFHLYNQEVSYIFCVLSNGQLGHLYYGKRINPDESYLQFIEGEYRSLTSFVSEENSTFSLQHTRQEYPSFGTGDYADAAFMIKTKDGSRLSDFKFYDFKIQKGKPTLEGLPSTYVDSDEEAETLTIQLRDDYSQTLLELTYTIYENRPVITRHARFEQLGDEVIVLEKALSMSLDLLDSDFKCLHLDGAWGRERHVNVLPLKQGCHSIYSLKGASSAEHNPFLALLRGSANENFGEVFGFSLVYSGNFIGQIDVSPYDEARINFGIHPENFEWLLSKGDSFMTPEVVMVYSDCGLNGMSQTFHSLFRQRLVRGKWRDRLRPVLLNNWEAMTFDFDEKRILTLAKEAASVGIELFVMDDGWFGKRNSDRSGLGDWTVNHEKLPHGLTGLIESIHEMGMSFGLWIEPEMVNKDSDLYREHPDWIFHHPERNTSHGRFQYTLNLANEAVYQNIYQQLHHLLANHEIDYIKWDMNRYMSEVFSPLHSSQQQGELSHRYILNLYRLYDALTSEFPNVLFESCSSGGGRFDPAMLYYAPQTWTSDNSDAIERLKIQYGTSMVYPLSSMGCHVSEVPNQQVQRITPLSTRANVAYFGSFGYELDLSTLSNDEKKAITNQIAFYKNYRHVFQRGEFTRLISPFESKVTAWQVMSEDGNQGFVAFYRTMVTSNEGRQRLMLQNLQPEAIYKINHSKNYSGATLMNAGLVIDKEAFVEGLRDFTSLLISIEKQ